MRPVLIASLLLAGTVACSPGQGGAPDAEPLDRPVPGEERDSGDHPETGPEEAGPEEVCAPDHASPLTLDRLIPQPVRVLGWGGDGGAQALPATVTSRGLDPEERQAFEALAIAAGMAPGPGTTEGDLSLTVHGEQEWAAMADACAPDLWPSPEAYLLRWSTAADGRHRLELFAPSPAGRRMALQTIRQLFARLPLPTRELLIADAPATDFRGVIETYYGAPWKTADRLALMSLLAGWRFNQFVYASKIDPWLNWVDTYWKEGWPAEYLEDLRTMTTAVRQAGMQAGLQVRPLAAVVFSSEEDRTLFVEAVLELLDTGFSLFSLSFDDTDPILLPPDAERYASHDEAIVDFAADVLSRLHQRRADLLLGFVPTDYWSQAEGASESLSLAGRRLPGFVTIGWTGPEVLSPTVTPEDADLVASWLGRRPLLGDNYPVIDNAGERIFLGPIAGRSPDLPGHLAGLLFNPMPLPFASLPALATCADYAWNSAAYDPDRAMTAAAAVLAGEGNGAQALRLLADTNRSPFLEGSMAPRLQAAIEDFWTVWDAGTDLRAALEVLQTGYFQPFSQLPLWWESVALTPLREEVRPWAQVLGEGGEAGLLALDLLKTRRAGGRIDENQRVDLETRARAIREARVRPTGSILSDFLDRVLGEIGTEEP